MWLVLGGVERAGGSVHYDVHFLARDEPDLPPEPFLSACGYTEPAEGFVELLRSFGEAVAGPVTALRHDPVSDGLSIELKCRSTSSAEGRPVAGDSFELVVWLDLTRMGRAMRVRGRRGRHQAGLRLFTTRAHLEAFRADLSRLATGSEPS